MSNSLTGQIPTEIGLMSSLSESCLLPVGFHTTNIDLCLSLYLLVIPIA
jgi:hypothetical protein